MNNVSITGRITRMIDSKSTDGYTILNFPLQIIRRPNKLDVPNSLIASFSDKEPTL